MSSVFLDSTWKWDYTVFLFLCMTLFLSIMPSRSIYLVTNDRISFFLWLSNIPLYIWMCIYKNYTYIHTRTHHVFFIHSSIDGGLGCFCMLAIVKKSAVMNIGIQISFWDRDFTSFGCIPRSEIAEFCDSSSFNFLGNLHILFHVALPMYIPTNSVQGFLSHILTSICHLSSVC